MTDFSPKREAPEQEWPRVFRELAAEAAKDLTAAWGENLVSVILYGSAARGHVRRDSDIDLLVVAEKLPTGIFARGRLFDEAIRRADGLRKNLESQGLHPTFSPILKTRQEATYHPPLYLDMVDDAVFLFDRGDFFKGVLESLRSNMQKLGSRKVYIGTQWYWDLKPDYKFGEVFEL